MTVHHSLDADKVTVAMITYNETRYLSDVLQAVAGSFPSFAVLDMGSTDETVAISRDILGAKLTLAEWPRSRLFAEGFAAARNAVSSLCDRPWILHLDADEVLTQIEPCKNVPLSEDVSRARAWKVQRRNLIGVLPAPVTVRALQSMEALSTEAHVRLYERNENHRWVGYIHEELTIDGVRAADIALPSLLNIEHLALLRPEAERLQKEKLYAWMLMNACNSTDLKQKISPDFVQYTKTNIGWLQPLAEDFAAQNGFLRAWSSPAAAD
jgi:glycosyltransferase involved in cell wall biosynthesis